MCHTLGITQSMGRSALDNAAAESFFSTLEFEILSRRHFATKAQARWEVGNWIDWLYKPPALPQRPRLPQPRQLREVTAAVPAT